MTNYSGTSFRLICRTLVWILMVTQLTQVISLAGLQHGRVTATIPIWAQLGDNYTDLFNDYS